MSWILDFRRGQGKVFEVKEKKKEWYTSENNQKTIVCSQETEEGFGREREELNHEGHCNHVKGLGLE